MIRVSMQFIFRDFLCSSVSIIFTTVFLMFMVSFFVFLSNAALAWLLLHDKLYSPIVLLTWCLIF